jgi:phosphoribosylamine--glycine ligase
MGSVSPVPFVNETLMEKVQKRIIDPTLAGLSEEKIDYRGFIFLGLINVGGDPFVIEYNCRMGDPETQVVMPRLETDLAVLLQSLFDGSLAAQHIEESPAFATAVVLASGGYPGSYEKGKPITLPEDADNQLVIQAGTAMTGNGLVTSGGRVLAAVGIGDTLNEALDRANRLAGEIRFENKYFRKDIGFDL